MTVEELVRAVNDNLGLIGALGTVALGVLVLWLRKHFYTRKEGKALAGRVGELETTVTGIAENVKHLPTPTDVAGIKDELAKVQAKQGRAEEKMIGFQALLERIEAQNNQIIGCLMDRRGKSGTCMGD